MDASMRITLWVLLHDADYLKRTTLEPMDFPRGATRYIVETVRTTWADSRNLLTPTIFQAQLEQDGDLVTWGTTQDEVTDLYEELYDRFEETEADAKAKRLVANKQLRLLRVNRHLDEATEAAEAGDVDGAERALKAGHRDSQPDKREIILDAKVQATEMPRQKPALPTGLTVLDKWWMGGLHLGQLGVILAPSNTGKTMILPFFTAQALKEGKNVIYYTTEVPDYEIYKRVLSALTQTAINDIDPADALAQIKHTLTNDDEARLGHLSIRFRDTGTLTAADISIDIEEKKEQGIQTHLVILDGDDIGVAGDKKSEKLYDYFFHIYGQLAALVMLENIGIWTAAQAQREADDKTFIKASNVGDSLWKLRRADVMLGLVYNEKVLDADGRQMMKLTVLKDRYYGKKNRKFYIYPKFGYKGSAGIVGFDQQLDEEEDPFASFE